MTTGFETETYRQMLAKSVPHLIHSEAEALHVQDQIDAILDKPGEPTAEERELLGLLGGLVFLWEEGRYELPETTPIERVRALIEENGLHQKDLVGAVFPTESVASEVLAGKRRLTYDFVDNLARFFHLSPAAFYPSATEVRRD